MNVPELLTGFWNNLPRRDDGRIDYSKSAEALVVTVVVEHEGDILLLKRSDKVSAYKGKWNVIAGYYDELKSIQEKALEEIQEETDISAKDIFEIRLGEPFEFDDTEIGKKWIVVPCFAPLRKKPEITIDYEHTEYKWIKFSELKDYDTVPNLKESVGKFLQK